MRLIVITGLLLCIGLATYQVGRRLWANHEHAAALQALAHYDYGWAAQRLESYLAFYPTDSAARLLAAQIARRRGDFAESSHQLHLAEQLGEPQEMMDYERQLLRIQAGDATGSERLVQFCTDNPDNSLSVLGMEAIIEGSLRSLQLQQAKRVLQVWLKHRPDRWDQAQGLAWRGQTHELMQDFPQALADYQSAAALAPENPRIQLRLAEALLRNDPRQAAAHLDWLRNQRPRDPEVLLPSARLARNLGQPEKAVPLLDLILSTTPDWVPALIERGRVALDLHQPQQAETWLRRAVQMEPQQRDANLALADCLRQRGNLEEARVYQDRALEIEARLLKRLEELTQKKQSEVKLAPLPSP